MDEPVRRIPKAHRVALHVSDMLANTLNAELRQAGFEVITLTRWANRDAGFPSPSLDLLIYEVDGTDINLPLQALRKPEFRWVNVICIGSASAELRGTLPNLHTLPAHTETRDVLQLAARLVHEAPPSDPANSSAEARPVSVLPRRSERAISSQAPPSLRSPASLLPNPNPQSSKPPRLRSVPAAPGSASGRLIDEASAGPQHFSRELLELLAQAEQRANEEFASKLEADANGKEPVRLELMGEVLDALDAPIGSYHDDAHPKSTLAVVPAALGAEADSETKAQPSEVGSSQDEITAAPTSPRSRAEPSAPTGVDLPERRPWLPDAAAAAPPTEAPFNVVSAETVIDRTSRTRPPRTSTIATQRVASPLPKAPALPRDVWVERALGRMGSSADLTRPGLSESIGPETSRSAQPAPPSDWPATTAPPHYTAPLTQRERVSTVPPSTAHFAASLLEQSATRTAPRRTDTADQTTTRPPRRRDSSSPSHDSAPSHGSAPATESLIDSQPKTPETNEDARRREAAPKNPALSAEVLELREGDAVTALANAIRKRFSGAIAFESEAGVRRVVLRDGDLVTAASSVASEALVAYLISTGALPKDKVPQIGHRLASFGRHAGAALIAGGYLAQDQLWPTLRAHVDFIVGRALSQERGNAAFETTIPERLQSEPSVFGGATGSEVLVEIVRRVIDPEVAARRLGGEHVCLEPGPQHRLLEECALTNAEREALQRLPQERLGDALAAAPSAEFACTLYALTQLGVLSAVRRAPPEIKTNPKSVPDPLDDEALKQAITARLALVENGDYFALLGVPRSATAYHIRRAFLDLRHRFEPSVILRPSTLEFKDDVDVIVEVLDEAYQVLKDPLRRERYRRALEAVPPEQRG